MAKKTQQTICKEVVDLQTGECVKVESKKVFTEKINPEHFYLTFIDYIAPLYKLTSVSARNLLDWMCEHAEYNSGIVRITSKDRQELRDTLEMSDSQISNSIRKLKELKLIDGGYGQFQINPEIFWKGDLKSRKQLLEGSYLKTTFEIVNPED